MIGEKLKREVPKESAKDLFFLLASDLDPVLVENEQQHPDRAAAYRTFQKLDQRFFDSLGEFKTKVRNIFKKEVERFKAGFIPPDVHPYFRREEQGRIECGIYIGNLHRFIQYGVLE